MTSMTGPFRDPMQVPYVFIDTNDAATRAADEWLRATFNAADTETAPIDFKEVKVHGVDRDDWRVHSHAAAFTDLDGIDPHGLVTDGIPDDLAERGVVGIKTYVIDVGYVDPAAFAPALEQLDVYVWNGPFERKVFRGAGFRARLLEDLMLYQANLDAGVAGAGKSYTGLAVAARDRLGWDLEGKGGIQLSYRRVADVPTLSDEQKAYAAQDAIATLLMIRPIVGEAEQVLTEVDGHVRSIATNTRIGCRAAAFLDEMTMTGAPLVVEGHEVVAKDGKTYDGWRGLINARKRRLDAVEGRLSDLLTDRPAQGMFTFGTDDEEPTTTFKTTFNAGSNEEVRELLNARVPELVKAYTAVWLESDRDGNPGEGRLLREGDTVDKDALKLIGGDLAETLMEWSKHAKILSDCGNEFLRKHVNDTTGRLHPKINQSLVATGRLSMEEPAMQNRPPELKRFIREDGMVVLYADMSQAELRTLAHISQDEQMLQAYRNGEDLHTATARVAFKLDMVSLMGAAELGNDELVEVARDNRVPLPASFTGLPSADDPTVVVDGTTLLRSTLVEACIDWAKLNRSKAKVPNFGIAYGLSPQALTKNLALQGVFVPFKEGNEILEQWLEGYEGVARWLQERVDTVAALAKDPPKADFWSTMRLATWHKPIRDAFHRTKRQLGRNPTSEELVERVWTDEQLETSLSSRLGRVPDGAELTQEKARLAEFVSWVQTFRVPLVVMPDGTPVQFASFTLGGRRRLFQITTDDWFEAMSFAAMESDRPLPTRLRHEFGARHNLTLATKDGSPLSRGQIPYALPKKSRKGQMKLREEFARYIFQHSTPEQFAFLARKALSARIRRLTNQFRNHPIQGTVGDAAELAYALLDERVLQVYPDIKPMLTVHDSIFLLCPMHLAREVAPILQSTIEEALGHYCSSVPTVADAVIAYSADEFDVVDEQELIEAERAHHAPVAVAA